MRRAYSSVEAMNNGAVHGGQQRYAYYKSPLQQTPIGNGQTIMDDKDVMMNKVLRCEGTCYCIR